MTVTVRDIRLLGAERAEVIPDFGGIGGPGLLVPSPQTEQVVHWEIGTPIAAASSIHLPGRKPRRIVYDDARQEAWVWCDDGSVERCSRESGYPVYPRVPVFELGLSGGYRADEIPSSTLDGPGFTPEYIDSSGAVASWFPAIPALGGKYRFVFPENVNLDFTISVSFADGLSFGSGTPADSGGIIVCGYYDTDASTYTGAIADTYPSQLWWDRWAGDLYRMQYRAPTYTWTVTPLYP